MRRKLLILFTLQFTQRKDPDYAQIAASVVKDAQSLYIGHLVEFKYTNRPFGQFTQADVRVSRD